MYLLLCALAIGAISIYQVYRRRYDLASLRGKALFVTGCDSGFGQMMALHFSQAGAHVFAACLSPESAASLKTDSNAEGKITTLVMDVTDDNHVQQGLEFVKAELQETKQRLYAVINNAGIATGAFAELLPLDDYKRVMDVNYFGCVRVTKTFLSLLKVPGGRIITITSCAALLAGEGASAYAASKSAQTGFLDSLRRELQPVGIRVIKIVPGFFKTPMLRRAIEDTAENQHFANASHEVQRRYAARVARTKSLMSNVYFLAGDPQNVVRCVERALLRLHPPTSFVVGYDSVLLWKPISLLPESWADALLRGIGGSE